MSGIQQHVSSGVNVVSTYDTERAVVVVVVVVSGGGGVDGDFVSVITYQFAGYKYIYASANSIRQRHYVFRRFVCPLSIRYHLFSRDAIYLYLTDGLQ